MLRPESAVTTAAMERMAPPPNAPAPEPLGAAAPIAPHAFDAAAVRERIALKAPRRVGGALRRLHLALRDRMPDAWVVQRNYFHRFGVYPDLRNPRRLTEKITWLKLHGATPLHTRCADKIAVRPWVAERIGAEYLVRAILIADTADALTPEAIPDAGFVVKATHDTGSVVICTDRAGFDWEACRARMRRALATPFWRRQRERHYRDIPPRLIVEELLVPDDPVVGLTDYKLLCFHGEPQWIECQIRPPGALYAAAYSLDWARLPWLQLAETADSVQYPGELPRPSRLEEMLHIVRTLAAPFPLVRVDLYEVGGRVLFGELTFTPAAGLERTEYTDPAVGPWLLDEELGDRLDMDRVRARLVELWAG